MLRSCNNIYLTTIKRDKSKRKKAVVTYIYLRLKVKTTGRIRATLVCLYI
jgi:hypothetical protein